QAIGGNRNQSSSNPAPSINGPNDAFGGGIHLSGGTATISGCTVEHNAAIAGAGGAGQNGGLAWGGGLDTFNGFGFGLIVTVSNSTVSHNSVTGGAGGPGGDGGFGWGGGLANLLGSVLTVSNSTVDHNLAVGGAGGSGGNGGRGRGGRGAAGAASSPPAPARPPAVPTALSVGWQVSEAATARGWAADSMSRPAGSHAPMR